MSEATGSVKEPELSVWVPDQFQLSLCAETQMFAIGPDGPDTTPVRNASEVGAATAVPDERARS